MKTSIKVLFVLSIILGSCSEPNDMLTVINDDGSFYREFSANVSREFIQGDTTDNNNPFPVEIDSTCLISWRFRNSEWFTIYPADSLMTDSVMRNTKLKNKESQGENKSTDFEVIMRIHYKSVLDMAEKFRLKKTHEWSPMEVHYSLDTKFRWFYTYYIYQETYPKIEMDFGIPIEKFMTKDEAKYWFTGKPNVLKGMNGIEAQEYLGKMEEGFNQWYARNCWNREFKVLLLHYNEVKDKPVSPERLKALCDTIYDKQVKENTDFKMKQVLKDYFKTDAFSVLWKDGNRPMKLYEEDYESQPAIAYFHKAINYKLIMPGKVNPPEDVIMQGDTLNWSLTAYRLVPEDFVIEASSRKANIWAFIVTGLILLIAIGSFIRIPKK